AGNTLFSGPVTQAMLTNGLTLAIDAPVTGTNLVVTATVTDPAGNTATGNDAATLDYGIGSGAPASPTVTIDEDSNDDGFINDAELDGQINITVELGAGTAVGDTLVVTDQAGNELFSGPVTQAMIDDDLSLVMDAPATGTNLVITATVTDPAGNTATDNDSATLDYGSSVPLAPTVDITEDANGDGFINDAELNGQINITVTLGEGTEVGDTLVVTDQDNNVLFSGPVTQAMLDNNNVLDLAIDAPVTGTNLVVTATVTDPAGNTATGDDSALLDYGVGTGAPAAPQVEITEDTNDDGFINDAELDGQINITVELGEGTAIGDTLVVTDQDGNELFNGTVTQAMLDNGQAVVMDAPATGTNVIVTAMVTDPAGNTATASDNALLDYGTGVGAPAAPVVDITEDTNGDGFINDAELDGQINITVTLGDGTQVGDTLVVTDQDNNVLFSGPVTQAMLDNNNGLDLAIDAPATGTQVVITATVTDPAGNTAQGTDSATLDYGTGTGAPGAPLVEITEDANDDGFINDAELDGQINATITLMPGTAIGDTILITDQDGNELVNETVTQAMLDDGIEVSFDAPTTGTNVVVTATVTDPAGNTASASDNALLDYGTGVGAPAAPTVEIVEDANDDGTITDAELDGQINITVTLGSGTEVGDTITITDQDNNVLYTGPVTQEMLDNDNGIDLAIDAPASGTNLVITATVTDVAGNTATGTDSATLDYDDSVTVPGAPTVVITEDTNNDGYINDAELEGQINITVELGANTVVGDTLVVTDQAGNELFSGTVTQDMLDNGLDLAMDPPATGTNLVITATVTDTLGNEAAGSDNALLDYGSGSGAPAAPTVNITEDINNDGFINDAELDGQINATVTLGAGTVVGDTVTITDQDGNTLFTGTVTQAMLDNGIDVSFDAPATGTDLVVTATVTDAAGNSAEGSDAATLDYGTGTGAPASPTVVIDEDANNDGFINEAELDGQIDITVTLGAGTAVGDTLVVTDQNNVELFSGTVTQAMIDDGLAIAFDAPATGTNLVVTATVTDAAGNTADGSDAATLDYSTGTGAPAAPTVVIDEDANNDGFINDAELDGQIDATVTLGAGT
ncbi:beta strand repeat-containing protein, partial [Shewanella nanhaiensis]